MASLKKRGKKYSLRFVRTIEGNRQEKTISLQTGKKEIAVKLKRKLEVDYELGNIDVFSIFNFENWKNGIELSDKSSSSLLLSDKISEFLVFRADLKKKTLSNYRSILNRFNSDVGESMPLSLLKYEDITDFVFDDDLAIPSQNNYLRHLKVFFKWVFENNYSANLCAGIKLKTETDTLRQQIISEADLKLILDSHKEYIQQQKRQKHITTDSQSQIWFAPLVKFTYQTGFRLSEVLNLKWKDVDFKSNQVTTVGKYGKLRTMILFDQAKKDLACWRQSTRSDPNRYVFESPKSRSDKSIAMTDHVSSVFKENVRRAQLDDYIHFHSLRHSCATNLLKKGFNPHSVQKMLGHESFSTTQRYLHLVPADLREEAKKLGEITR